MSDRLAKITANVQTVNNGAAIALDATPILGGAGKKGIVRCPVLPLTSTVLVQGAPAIDASTGIAPVAGSALWTTLNTFTSTADQVQEITLPALVRYRTSVLDADGPDVALFVEAAP